MPHTNIGEENTVQSCKYWCRNWSKDRAKFSCNRTIKHRSDGPNESESKDVCKRNFIHLNLPRIEKKIINPADIWMTLRLPTRVNANRPAFSLQKNNPQWPERIRSCEKFFLHRYWRSICCPEKPIQQNGNSLQWLLEIKLLEMCDEEFEFRIYAPATRYHGLE